MFWILQFEWLFVCGRSNCSSKGGHDCPPHFFFPTYLSQSLFLASFAFFFRSSCRNYFSCGRGTLKLCTKRQRLLHRSHSGTVAVTEHLVHSPIFNTLDRLLRTPFLLTPAERYSVFHLNGLLGGSRRCVLLDHHKVYSRRRRCLPYCYLRDFLGRVNTTELEYRFCGWDTQCH